MAHRPLPQMSWTVHHKLVQRLRKGMGLKRASPKKQKCIRPDDGLLSRH